MMALRTGCSKAVATLTATRVAAVPAASRFAELTQERRYSTLPVTFSALGPAGRSSVSGITATVFGSTGFLGRYVVSEVAQMGSRMMLPTRCDDADRTHLKVMGDLGQMNFIDFDARSPEDIAKAIKGSNVVINMIGREMESSNFPFPLVHVDIAKAIAEACAAEGVQKLIHVSALGASASSKSRYYQTKAAGEDAVKVAFPTASIVRPAVMYGWEDRLFNRMAQASSAFPFLPLVDGGETKYQPVHVHDVGIAIAAIVTSDKVGLTYELAGPESFSMKELTDLCFSVIREKPNTLNVPSQLAKMAAAPLDMVMRTLPVPVSLPIAHGSFTVDAVNALEDDYLASGKLPGFRELELEPRKLEGLNVDYLRSYRAGGYDFGTEHTESDRKPGSANDGTPHTTGN